MIVQRRRSFLQDTGTALPHQLAKGLAQLERGLSTAGLSITSRPLLKACDLGEGPERRAEERAEERARSARRRLSSWKFLGTTWDDAMPPNQA